MTTDNEPGDPRAAALTRAAAFGGTAPSIHNSQPWRWHIGDGTLDLALERRRLLWSSDPDSRLAVLSCGIALHHARLELAALGWEAEVDRTPAGEDGIDRLARISLGPCGTPEHHAVRLVGAAGQRRTDRRTAPTAPVDFHRLRSIATAAQDQGADVRLLRPRQLLELAGAVERAREVERADAAWQVELAGWVGGSRPSRTGIPADALPADPFQLVAPGRALRRAGATLVDESRDRASVFGVLCTPGDDRIDWLRAGEGLSAGWLTATVLDVSVLPLSIVTEVATSRATVRGLIGWTAHPHLALRFAASPAVGPEARTPRLPLPEIIERD